MYATIMIYFRVFYALLFLVASTSKVDYLFYYFLDSINTQYLHNYYMHLLYNRNDGVEENHLFDIYTKCFYQVRAVLPLEMIFFRLV